MWIDRDNAIDGNLLEQLVLCTSEIRHSPALALYCLTIWFARNRVKLVILFPCDGQTFLPLANTLIGTEMVRTGRQRSRQLFGVTHTDEFLLRSTVPAAQKQPCMCKEEKKHCKGVHDDLHKEYIHAEKIPAYVGWLQIPIAYICTTATCTLTLIYYCINYILLTSHALQCAGSGEWTLHVCAGLGTGGPTFLKLEAWRAFGHG